MSKGFMVLVTTDHKSHYSPPGAEVLEVEVIDRENRLIKYQSGNIQQLSTIDRVYQTAGEAMMAGAEQLQSHADSMAALAAKAREDAAKLAAAGRVEVCST